MNKKLVLDCIRNYIHGMKSSKKCWNVEDFRQASYSRWAAQEFYDFVNKKTSIELSDLESYVECMDELSCRNGGTSYIFAVAKDISEDILEAIIIFFERRNYES